MWQPKRNFDWAATCKDAFSKIFPEHICETAIATCRFLLLGKDANGNKYGKGFRTFMQTYGNVPVGLRNDVQIRHNWIELDAHESANLILGCFGLSTDDVYRLVGVPVDGEQIDISLHDIVNAIAADDDYMVDVA